MRSPLIPASGPLLDVRLKTDASREALQLRAQRSRRLSKFLRIPRESMAFTQLNEGVFGIMNLTRVFNETR